MRRSHRTCAGRGEQRAVPGHHYRGPRMDELVEERAEVGEPPAERPSRRRDWRWWVGGTGRVLIVVGLLLLGFVAYQLWGTGIEHARAQIDLEHEFNQQLATTAAPTTTVAPTTVAPSP